MILLFSFIEYDFFSNNNISKKSLNKDIISTINKNIYVESIQHEIKDNIEVIQLPPKMNNKNKENIKIDNIDKNINHSITFIDSIHLNINEKQLITQHKSSTIHLFYSFPEIGDYIIFLNSKKPLCIIKKFPYFPEDETCTFISTLKYSTISPNEEIELVINNDSQKDILIKSYYKEIIKDKNSSYNLKKENQNLKNSYFSFDDSHTINYEDKNINLYIKNKKGIFEQTTVFKLKEKEELFMVSKDYILLHTENGMKLKKININKGNIKLSSINTNIEDSSELIYNSLYN